MRRRSIPLALAIIVWAVVGARGITYAIDQRVASGGSGVTIAQGDARWIKDGGTFTSVTVTGAAVFDGGTLDITTGAGQDLEISTGGGSADMKLEDTGSVMAGNGTSPLVLGKAASSGHSLAGDDVLVGGKIEVDGAAYLDSTLTAAGIAYFEDSFQVMSSSGNQSAIFKGIADDGLHIVPNSSNGKGNNNIIFTTDTSWNKDHDHDVPSTDLTVFIHSDLNPDTNNTRWGSFHHTGTAADGGSFVIETGAGAIDLAPATGGVRLGRVIDAAPAEPTPCTSVSEGMIVYASDTNDTAYGRVCICSLLDGTGYDWRDLSDITGTACPFF